MTKALHEDSAYLVLDKSYPKILRDKFSKDRLSFTYLPEEISDSGAEPNYNEIEIIGRWEPYQIYGNTGARTFSINLTFFAEDDFYEDVKAKCDWLRAMKYPVVSDGVSYRPPTLLFIWGDLIAQRVILRSVDITYRGPWQVEVDNGGVTYPLLPIAAEASLELAVVSNTPVTGPDVMAGSDSIFGG